MFGRNAYIRLIEAFMPQPPRFYKRKLKYIAMYLNKTLNK